MSTYSHVDKDVNGIKLITKMLTNLTLPIFFETLLFFILKTQLCGSGIESPDED